MEQSGSKVPQALRGREDGKAMSTSKPFKGLKVAENTFEGRRQNPFNFFLFSLPGGLEGTVVKPFPGEATEDEWGWVTCLRWLAEQGPESPLSGCVFGVPSHSVKEKGAYGEKTLSGQEQISWPEEQKAVTEGLLRWRLIFRLSWKGTSSNRCVHLGCGPGAWGGGTCPSPVSGPQDGIPPTRSVAPGDQGEAMAAEIWSQSETCTAGSAQLP